MPEQRNIDCGSYRIEVSPDNLIATLCVDAGAEVSSAVVIAKLKEIGICNFDDGELIQALQTRKPATALSLVVARGTAASDERPGRIDYRVPVANPENGLVCKVSAGQLIATIGPVIAGSDGRDVLGAVLAAKKAAALQVGSGVAVAKGSLTATMAGNARQSDDTIAVHPLLEIYGDDQNAKPLIDVAGDVAIKGCLADGHRLTATGCLVVGGAIEAALFKVGQWVHVKGGVIAREKGSGLVGGDLWCRFALGARLSVGGDVHVQSEIANSRITCTGRLTVVAGPISGGEVVANAGIACQALGNPAGTTTVVEAGTDQTLRATIAETRAQFDANRKRIKDIREKVAPLMKWQKNLTPQQKEKATELLYDADELEEQIEKKRIELTDRCRGAVAKSNPEITINDMVYPGVIIRLPGVEATVRSAIQGPIRIVPRRCGDTTQVVVVQPDGASEPLSTIAVADHFRPFVERMVSGLRAA